ncbi:MAG: hypothetical protein LH618_04465 [Saprospiraceae bacterium]|nr:hypothetical protein [Saprospiraceae bacterium]
MPQNDPAPESRPVLIVSDGEEGHLIEKVIIDQKISLPAPQDDFREDHKEEPSTEEKEN